MAIMGLSIQHKKLLNEIFAASLQSPNGLNAPRFRANNSQLIPALDQLEQLNFVKRDGDVYSVSISALNYLPKENIDAQTLIQNCGLVFALLQGSYRDYLEQKMTVHDISKGTGLSELDVFASLKFIIQTGILRSHSINNSGVDPFVTPSESTLRYKSFEDILKERQKWDELNPMLKIPASDGHILIPTSENYDNIPSPIELFDQMRFHQKVTEVSRQLFIDKHYALAILEACKSVELSVRDKSGLKETGTNLMAKAFGGAKPLIPVLEAGEYMQEVQEGFKFLFMGIMLGIRNPKAHMHVVQNDPYITLEYLGFASFLLKRIDGWHISLE